MRPRCGRSSTHRPTWLSGVACTAGFLSGSSGCIRSTSTSMRAAADRADVLVDVLALADGRCPSTLEAEHVDPQRAQALPCRARRWRSAGGRGCGTACPCVMRSSRANSRIAWSTARLSPLRGQHLARPRRPARRRGCSPSSSPRSPPAARRHAPSGPAATATSTSRPGIGDSRKLATGRAAPCTASARAARRRAAAAPAPRSARRRARRGSAAGPSALDLRRNGSPLQRAADARCRAAARR